jgi:hypothetical protein
MATEAIFNTASNVVKVETITKVNSESRVNQKIESAARRHSLRHAKRLNKTQDAPPSDLSALVPPAPWRVHHCRRVVGIATATGGCPNFGAFKIKHCPQFWGSCIALNWRNSHRNSRISLA